MKKITTPWMINMIQPYRQSKQIVVKEVKPLYGLIKAAKPVKPPKPPKPHECKKPGIWYRLFFGVYKNSFFRCPDCKRVYRLMDVYNEPFLQWECVYSEDWERAGGRLEEDIIPKQLAP